MQLGNAEYKSLEKFIRGLSNSQFGVGDRMAIANLNPNGSHQQLQSIGESTLQKLVNVLPSGKVAKVSSPILKSVRHKVKAALLGVRRPLLDPEHWPKVMRSLTKMNNARAGLRPGPGGQHFRLHGKAMNVSLTTPQVWDERNGGDLIIMGRWFEITAEIGKARGLALQSKLVGTTNDVNAEYDRMYGSMPGDDTFSQGHLDSMPFYVCCEAGPLFTPTMDQGEVVLDPRNEVVQLAGSAVTGFAGAGISFDGLGTVAKTAFESISVGADITGMVGEHAQSAYENRSTETKFDKTIFTVTIGTSPAASKYVSTDTTTLNSDQLLKFTLDAMQTCTKG